MSVLTFYVDTNLFLQCIALNELPWKDISQNHDIQLVIARTVRNEIDRLKQDGNSRRADRARKTNSIFKKILQAGDNGFSIKSESPSVQIILGPNFNKDSLLHVHEDLDLTQNDNVLIAEALAYSKKYPTTNVYLLTHDVNPLYTAKQVGLQSQIIPDSWLLPPEQDNRDKRIAALEAQINKLEKQLPLIEVFWDAENCLNAERFSFEIPYFPPLQPENIEILLESIKSANPIETNLFSVADSMSRINNIVYPFIIQPTNKEISRYQDVDYPNWLNKIKEFFFVIHKRLNAYYMRINLVAKLSNIGTVPANHVIFTVSVQNGLLIAPPSTNKEIMKNNEISFSLPSAPSPPKARLSEKEMFQRLLKPPNINIDSLNRLDFKTFDDRDRYLFYWKPERPTKAVDNWEFECEEFRHKIESEKFSIGLILSDNMIIKNASIKCQLTASNMPVPFTYIMPIEFSYIEKDTMEIAKKACKKICAKN